MKIGIDLGGSKVEGIVLGQNGAERHRKRIETPRGDYQQIIEAVVQLTTELAAIAGEECTVGIGTPGSLNRQGLLRNSNTTELNGKPILQDLQTRLQQPVRISNDANCFALSEARDGAGVGFATVFGVIIGTGTGSGIVVNGELLPGANHVAGEWGHNPLPWAFADEWPGDLCYCGKIGCIETFLSGPALSLHYRRLSGYTLTARQIAAEAEQGNALADQVLSQYELRLARALASVINLLDPDCIVLGGGLSNIQRFYERIPQLWKDYVFSDSVDTALLPPEHGDSSGVRGAAELWNQK
ncbi:ROK family protein [Proteobacteria bacterium 005FR1]|nr:ROK family protein [Proteobacteria bacterium 005FR1]